MAFQIEAYLLLAVFVEDLHLDEMVFDIQIDEGCTGIVRIDEGD